MNIIASGIELLVVEVPDSATNFRIEIGNYNVFLGFNESAQHWIGVTPLQTMVKIISPLRDITEAECQRLVDKTEFGFDKDNQKVVYNNYMATNCRDFRDIVESSFNSAKESLISLLQSKGQDTTKNLILIEKRNEQSAKSNLG